jgi:hypothetical protein
VRKIHRGGLYVEDRYREGHIFLIPSISSLPLTLCLTLSLPPPPSLSPPPSNYFSSLSLIHLPLFPPHFVSHFLSLPNSSPLSLLTSVYPPSMSLSHTQKHTQTLPFQPPYLYFSLPSSLSLSHTLLSLIKVLFLVLLWYYSNIVLDISLFFCHCLPNIYVFHIILYRRSCKWYHISF